MNSIYRRSDCRLCNGTNVESVLKMVPTPIGDAYLSDVNNQETYPVELFLCNDCGHAQLLDVLNPEKIYLDYIYKTSDSLGLVNHFKDTVTSILNKTKPEEGSLIVDIGSNDGSFLSFFKERGMNVLGVEPAKEVGKLAVQKGIDIKNTFFSLDVAKDIKESKGTAKIITSNNTFANIDDLNSFMVGVKELLDEEGVFVFETGYVLDLLQKKIFDNIYHEHLSYFSVKPLKLFFEKYGMKLIDVERISPKGGSLRCFVKKQGNDLVISESVENLIKLETELGIHKSEIFNKLGEKITDISNKLRNCLRDLKNKGKVIAGYGASVGVTTVLYNFNINNNLIDFLVDDNIKRQGTYSPGLHIPVKSSKELYNTDVDYVVILAWMYSDPIVKRNLNYLKKGGKFITILPSQKIISEDESYYLDEVNL